MMKITTLQIQLMLYSYGKNVTLVCPIQLGALFQAYSVSWQFRDLNDTMFEIYNTTITNDLLPAVTIYNIQESDLGTYICTVNVTNPYDGMAWTVSSTFILQSKLFQLSLAILFKMIAPYTQHYLLG